MAEGTPLERVQVVNSGARVQIPPSPLVKLRSDFTNWHRQRCDIRTLTNKQQCNPEKHSYEKSKPPRRLTLVSCICNLRRERFSESIGQIQTKEQ